MNIDSLLNYYFKDCNAQPLIEVFDTENIYNIQPHQVHDSDIGS